MNYEDNSTSDEWVWEDQSYTLEGNTTTEISKILMHGVQPKEDHHHCLSDDTTPLKACGDLAYRGTGKEVGGKDIEECSEPYSQVKRRRMLHFEPDFLDPHLCTDELFLRSKETRDSLEDAISGMSEWVAGFADDTNASAHEYLDPSTEGWITDCLNETEMQFSAEEMNASGASDIQIDIADLCSNSPEFDANTVEKLPVHTTRNVVFKGKKSYMHTPPKLASSIVYPFTFIKPCGAHGDMTLKDINQRLHAPKASKTEKDASVSYPTSAFSGKPVVGKTKILTEGGGRSITILRTKG